MRPVKNISDALGDPVEFDSLEEMVEAVNKLGYMPEDGLKEGRDFEYITMLMNPATGSVAPEEEWRQDYANMTEEEWGGPEFEDAGLVEVVPDGSGWWKEA